MDKLMFCYQCQETAGGTGCTKVGICGKSSELAKKQDYLVYATKLLSDVTTRLRKEGKKVEASIDKLITINLFTTITNANFDKEVFEERIKETIDIKNELLKKVDNVDALAEDTLKTELYAEDMDEKVSILFVKNEDIRSLNELITYGLKGLSAYMKHSNELGYDNEAINTFIQNTLSKILKGNLSVDELVALALEVGKFGVDGMALLDKANTETYGNPEITKVNIGTGKNPGILISGHDLSDIKELLEQTKGTGIDVYTHSEMLPAHYYPELKKYPHLVGNYGNAWWKQKEEFEKFNGPILMTTNCVVPPSDSYKDRLFTTGAAGFEGCKHIARVDGDKKDFSEIIDMAKRCKAPEELEQGQIIGGFAHNQVFALAHQIVEAVKSEKIKKFVVMAGCDGRAKSRNYYSDFAKALPKDTVILTAGCAKYKYNKLNLGDIGGIPRVLDAGQCNDSYSLVLIALKLQEAFGLKDVNELPIAYNIAWYEQKAVIVLLSLLHLNVKNIHLGPTLPAFLSKNVINVLIENFGISGITTVEEDMKIFGIE